MQRYCVPRVRVSIPDRPSEEGLRAELGNNGYWQPEQRHDIEHVVTRDKTVM
jgi:hypothetical protein